MIVTEWLMMNWKNKIIRIRVGDFVFDGKEYGYVSKIMCSRSSETEIWADWGKINKIVTKNNIKVAILDILYPNCFTNINKVKKVNINALHL